MFHKLIFILLSLFFISSVTGADSFDYDMISTCTTQQNNMCTEWKHSGNVARNAHSGGCFPENSYVLTLNGKTRMKDLHIGDHLLGYDIYSGSTLFSEMPTWFHFVRNETLDYVILQTKDGTLTASPSHNIGFSGDSDIPMFLHAKDFYINDNLIGFKYQPTSIKTIDVQEHPIVGMSEKTSMGLYAPYTRLNNYFVSDDGVYFYLAHSYAVIENPVAYEYMVGKTFDMLSMFVQIDESQNSFLNPIAKSLQSVFKLYEDPMSVFRYLRTSVSRSLETNDESDDDERSGISTGYNILEITDFLSLLASAHVTSVGNSTSNGTTNSI